MTELTHFFYLSRPHPEEAPASWQQRLHELTTERDTLRAKLREWDTVGAPGWVARERALVEVRAERDALRAVIEKVRALCHTMDRGVGYRVSGDHSTWGEYHEGQSDFAGAVEEMLDTGQPVTIPNPDHAPLGKYEVAD